MPRGGFPGQGLDSDCPTVPLCAMLGEGHASGPRGGELPPLAMAQVRHVCPLGGIE